jgi:hypothetical protein
MRRLLTAVCVHTRSCVRPALRARALVGGVGGLGLLACIACCAFPLLGAIGAIVARLFGLGR